jgi:hypothetical protein
MVDLELLARRARRAAEWGRLRAASRIALGVVPLVLIALLVGAGEGAPAVVAIGAVLLALCIGLGWANASGGRAARSGLVLGAIPMTAALFAVSIEGCPRPSHGLTMCGAGCLVAGLVAGGGSAWWAMRAASPRPLAAWGQVGLVASLTTALGCIGLGAGGALGVIASVAAGSALAWIPARVRS